MKNIGVVIKKWRRAISGHDGFPVVTLPGFTVADPDIPGHGVIPVCLYNGDHKIHFSCGCHDLAPVTIRLFRVGFPLFNLCCTALNKICEIRNRGEVGCWKEKLWIVFHGRTIHCFAKIIVIFNGVQYNVVCCEKKARSYYCRLFQPIRNEN